MITSRSGWEESMEVSWRGNSETALVRMHVPAKKGAASFSGTPFLLACSKRTFLGPQELVPVSTG